MYGLNNPASANYVANLGERIRLAAELQVQAKALGTTVEALLESYSEAAA